VKIPRNNEASGRFKLETLSNLQYRELANQMTAGQSPIDRKSDHNLDVLQHILVAVFMTEVA
jgi:hypothetical protein